MLLSIGLAALGYVMRKLLIPIPPLVLSIVLGGLIEQSLRQAMTISGRNAPFLVGSPIAVSFLLLSVIVFVVPLVPWRQWMVRAQPP